MCPLDTQIKYLGLRISHSKVFSSVKADNCMLKNVIIFKLLHGLYLNGDMLQKTETYQSSKLKKIS